jgi:hypothetical protein
MSLSSSRHVPWILALWFATLAGLSDAAAQGTLKPRRSLELTETNSAEILTNLNLLNTKKEGISELDEQLKGLKKFSPDPMFEANWYVPYAPQSSGVPNKALKELLQRQNNWGLTPEELSIATKSLFDSEKFSVYGDDKGDKDKQSSLQQFYDALNNRSTAPKKQDSSTDINWNIDQNKRLDNRRELDSDYESNLPDAIRDKAKRLREMVNEDSSSIFNPIRPSSSFDNFFGLRNEASTREPVDQKKHGSESFIDQFKKTLDKQSAASSLLSGVSGSIPNPDAASRAFVLPGLEPFASSTHNDSKETTPRISTSLVDPTAMRDLNSTALNQWNSLYQPPKLVLPQTTFTPSSASVMQVPRRHF